MRKEIIFGVLGLLVLISLFFDTIKRRTVVGQAKSLLEKPQHSLLDPWGTGFLVEKLEDEIRVTSAGPDRKMHTKDDLLFLKKRKVGKDSQ